MRNLTVIALATALSAIPALSGAQSRLEVQQGSRLWIEGTSTLHAWTCRTSELKAAFELGGTADAIPGAGALSKVAVDVPVKSMKCGKGKMDENMYKALKANEFPSIDYKLVSYELLPGATKDSAMIRTAGTLTIAGVTKQISMDVTTRRDADLITSTGSTQMLMTDFGIKPPVVMAGMLKTGNKITVSFDIRTNVTPLVAAAWDAAVAGSR